MKFILKINGSEDKNAEFVGWTPVKCTLTVDGYNGDAPMPVTITPEHINKSGRIDLYLDNATSATPVPEIKHDFQTATELTFYVAGKFDHASVAEIVGGKVEGKDTFIYVKSNNSDLELKKNIMVRVRKNANELKQAEITLFLEAFVCLSKKDAKSNYPDPNNEYTRKPNNLLDEIVLMHTLDAQYEIHMRTSFHPWHRIFNLHLERELQAIFPEVTLPYWKFDEKADRVFTTNFIGETFQSGDFDEQNPEIRLPRVDMTNPLYSYIEHTTWGSLTRAYKEKNPATEKPERIYTEDQIINGSESSEYFLYWSKFEERRSHNQAHNAFTGRVVDIGRDPVDPLFFMMHSNVDRLWALWQEKHNRFDFRNVNTYPFQYEYAGERGGKWTLLERIDANDGIYQVNNDDLGNFVEDNLWPWDWDNILSRPMRKWNSNQPTYGMGMVPQINIEFPRSAVSHYPDGSITVKSTIDYQNRLNNQVSLGFDYEKIPYFDKDKNSLITNTMVQFKESDQNQKHNLAISQLVNKENDLQNRIGAVSLIDETTEIFLDTMLNIISDSSEPAVLRFKLVNEMVAAKRANRFFSSRKPRFFDILRGLIKDENKKIRFQAIEILSNNEDEIVQEFLTKELRKEDSEFISKQDAIFFLREAPKPQHSKLFLEIFNNSNDIDVKKAAIAGLGNNPESEELLKKVVLDDNEDFKVRESGALSLHNLNHKLMNSLAAQIIAKPEPGEGIKLFRSTRPNPDEVDFKAGLLNMLTFTGDINLLKDNEELKSSLREVESTSTQNKVNFKTSIESFTAISTEEPTILEQMARELLTKIEGNSNE
uniref:tyrosinase family protein n=1 Tax=Roseivirga sp. TaxID=1964215 RepID=UPI0040481B75